MSKIFDNLFLGSYADARNLAFLQKNQITHIVTVGMELKTVYPNYYKYLFIPADDKPAYKLDVYFDEIADFIYSAIHHEQGKVFVHCYWGISRSTTSVMAYLIKYEKMSMIKAMSYVKSRRNVIYPNKGFVQQLKAYAEQLGVDKENWGLPSQGSPTSLTQDLAENHAEIKKALCTQEALAADLKRAVRIRNNHNVGVLEYDYYCKKCHLRLFQTRDIEHNALRTARNPCNAIYLDNMQWIEDSTDISGERILCPNENCRVNLGYIQKAGGNCSCGKPLKVLNAIYPLKIFPQRPQQEHGQVQQGVL